MAQFSLLKTEIHTDEPASTGGVTVGADVTVGQVIGATPVHETDTPSWTCHITIKYINNNEGIHYKEVGNTNL